MRSSARTATAVAAATVAVAAAGAVTAHSSSPRQPAYGHQQIRSGVPQGAARFTVTSPDVRDHGTFPADTWANAFGCAGGNRQVRLSWHGAPAGTRSYAVTMYDPDAPSGAGFWHWETWDIPASARALGATPPAGSVVGTNDAGAKGYLGPCPPAGDVTHHYRITVYALDVPSLELPAETPATVTTFTMAGHVVGHADMTVTARR
ncbi:YbhB/YbcL family Raf kinase inhibitor-like protein [Streptomyces sp. NPDC004031]